MYYIITAHGKYAEGCKSSCEMITGDTSAFVPVTFTEEMTKEDVEKTYEEIRKYESCQREQDSTGSERTGGKERDRKLPIG